MVIISIIELLIYGVLSVSKLLWECAYAGVQCAYASVQCAYAGVQCAYAGVQCAYVSVQCAYVPHIHVHA